MYKEMYNIIYNKIKFNKIKKSMRIETNDDTIEWLNTVNSYIYKMSKIDKTVLYIYTTPLYRIINNYKATGEIINELLYEPITDYTPYIYDLILNDKSAGYFNGDLRDLIKIRMECKKQTNEDDYNNYYRRFEDEIRKKSDNFYSNKFFKKCVKMSIENSYGVMFYYQYVSLYGNITFREYCNKIPDITVLKWKKILNKYINQLDDIFMSIPRNNKKMVVYRGSSLGDLNKREKRGYISTTFSKDLAKDFGIIYKLEINRNSSIIPLLSISRYFVEQELLLYPTTRYIESRVV